MSSSCGSGWKVFIERGNSVALDKKNPQISDMCFYLQWDVNGVQTVV